MTIDVCLGHLSKFNVLKDSVSRFKSKWTIKALLVCISQHPQGKTDHELYWKRSEIYMQAALVLHFRIATW